MFSLKLSLMRSAAETPKSSFGRALSVAGELRGITVKHGAPQGTVTPQQWDPRKGVTTQVRLPYPPGMNQTPDPTGLNVNNPRETATPIEPHPHPSRDPEGQGSQNGHQQVVEPPTTPPMKTKQVEKTRAGAVAGRMPRPGIGIQEGLHPFGTTAHIDATPATPLAKRLAVAHGHFTATTCPQS